MPNPIEPGDRGEPGTAGVEPIVDVAVDDDVFAAEFDKAEEVGDKLDLSAGDDPKNIKKEEEEKEPPKEEAKKEEEPTIPDKPEIESEEKMEQSIKARKLIFLQPRTNTKYCLKNKETSRECISTA